MHGVEQFHRMTPSEKARHMEINSNKRFIVAIKDKFSKSVLPKKTRIQSFSDLAITLNIDSMPCSFGQGLLDCALSIYSVYTSTTFS